jgi:hypothetical protein
MEIDLYFLETSNCLFLHALVHFDDGVYVLLCPSVVCLVFFQRMYVYICSLSEYQLVYVVHESQLK